MPPSLTKTARDFGEGFLPDQPVSLSIGTVAKNDRNPKIAELAAKTLALTRQYSTLVEVLAQVPHDEAVEAAAKGLRAWLPLAANNVTLLQKELSMVFVPAVEDIVLGSCGVTTTTTAATWTHRSSSSNGSITTNWRSACWPSIKSACSRADRLCGIAQE